MKIVAVSRRCVKVAVQGAGGGNQMMDKDDAPFRPTVVDAVTFDTFATGSGMPVDCGGYYRIDLYQDRVADHDSGVVERVVVARLVMMKEDYYRSLDQHCAQRARKLARKN